MSFCTEKVSPLGAVAPSAVTNRKHLGPAHGKQIASRHQSAGGRATTPRSVAQSRHSLAISMVALARATARRAAQRALSSLTVPTQRVVQPIGEDGLAVLQTTLPIHKGKAEALVPKEGASYICLLYTSPSPRDS